MATGGASGASGSSGSTASTEDVADALSQFRDALRQTAIASIKAGSKEGGAVELSQNILKMCDALRDETLPPLGIQLDDRASGVAQVKLGDPKVLMAEAERKAEAAAAAEAAKVAK